MDSGMTFGQLTAQYHDLCAVEWSIIRSCSHGQFMPASLVGVRENKMMDTFISSGLMAFSRIDLPLFLRNAMKDSQTFRMTYAYPTS